MPTPIKITGRSSSITIAFINSIIPVIPPTESEVRKALRILQMEPYEQVFRPSSHNFAVMVGERLWSQHWENWQRIIDEMKQAQILASEINTRIKSENKAEHATPTGIGSHGRLTHCGLYDTVVARESTPNETVRSKS